MTTEYTLVLTEAERHELLRRLEQDLVEIHGEKRGTEAPAYRQELSQEERVLRGLVEKARKLRT